MTNRDDIALVRQEHLLNFGRFSRALAEAMTLPTVPEEKLSALRAAISAECAACGIHLTGEELLAVGKHPEMGEDSAKIARLREGYCARAGCNSYFYQLTFLRVPGCDWTEILAKAEASAIEQDPETTEAETAREAARRAGHRQLARRVVIGLAVLLLLLIARQWYVGGTIPLIRQPEHFRVDPAPPGHQYPR